MSTRREFDEIEKWLLEGEQLRIDATAGPPNEPPQAQQARPERAAQPADRAAPAQGVEPPSNEPLRAEAGQVKASDAPKAEPKHAEATTTANAALRARPAHKAEASPRRGPAPKTASRARIPKPVGLGAAALVAVIAVGSFLAWNDRSRPAPAAVTFGAPVSAVPDVPLVSAPLPSQAGEEAAAAQPKGRGSTAEAATMPTTPASAIATPLPGKGPLAAHPGAAAAKPTSGVPSPAHPAPPTSPPQDAAKSSLVALSDDARKQAAASTQATPSASATAPAPAAASAAQSAAAASKLATGALALPQRPAKAESADAARTLRYGDSGILALTTQGVVLFDRAKGTQRGVAIGDQLPDGSTVKAVQPTKHRIETDRGPITLQ